MQYHYDEILKLKPDINIFVLLLRGSQNCGIDDEKSDIDSRCIYIPSRPTALDNLMEYEVKLNNGEEVNFMDIRLFTMELRQRSLYAIEMLYSKWIIIPNPSNRQIWKNYQNLANSIVNTDKPAVALSILFYSNVKRKWLFNNFRPERYEDCIHHGYDGKMLSQIIRYHLLLELLNSEQEFDLCMDTTLNEKILPAKNSKMPVKSVYWLMMSLPRQIQSLQKEIEINYPKNEEEYIKVENQLLELQNQVLGEII